jgi:uncharacterized protein (DUF2141 family)
MFLLFITLFSWSSLTTPPSVLTSCGLDFVFEQPVSGTLFIAVYQDKGTWGKPDQAYKTLTCDVKDSKNSFLELNALPVGTYGIACYLDENGNQKLDQNWLGIPTEAYGFSKGARPSHRQATWQETYFTITRDPHKEQLVVKKW